MTRTDEDPEVRLARDGRWLHVGGLAIATALFAAVYVPAIGALHSEQQRIGAEIDAAARLVESAGDLRAEHQRLIEQEADSRARTQHLLARIPDAPQESEFLAHIARLAGQARLTIRDFRPVATTTHEKYSQVEIRLSADGGYEAICRFLAGLESLPRLCRMTRLTILAENAAAEVYPVEMTFEIYFAPERKAVPGTGGRP